MGNCLVVQENTIKVIKPDGKILEYRAPVRVEQVLSGFSNHAISDSLQVLHHLLPDTNLNGGQLYYLVPLPLPILSVVPTMVKKKVRFSIPEDQKEKEEEEEEVQENGVVRIKLVISKQKLQEMLQRGGISVEDMVSHLSSRSTASTQGADESLQNAAGWNPLQEALCRRSSEIALILLRLHHRSAWAKWRRRLPRLIVVLCRMRDFYMEILFHFESSVIPFVAKIAPSDTYKIWKRDGNLRADTSLTGFNGLKIQRADQSFLFLGDGNPIQNVPSSSLLVLFSTRAGSPMSESDIAGFCAQINVYQ
ncbi:hypothetical protein Tsubulata_020965 [Turnera subulata]|uniref:Ankyrin repeat domain-containing protein n=1 Tax=Turnera subulata TaxID=218843 RepID=A0A9Q0GJA1_9ROSI|nr:hypothetical protein Tsubulata_020965 [Turnera subulata]